MQILNLGILAHVDAGKTTLTERLLYNAGVIDRLGSVDEGTTQTDTLALERERGITIKSAVACFRVGDTTINLIDTPGHPDFIAEVERVLSVLDGAVLVISAVEGVQPQTPLLMRALRRLNVPTLIFVNKIDRPGADDRRTLDAIARRLTAAIVPMGLAFGLGTRDAGFRPAGADDATFGAALTELLAERDDAVMAAYVDDERPIPPSRLRGLLAQQTKRGAVHPVFFGSAITGAGVEPLMAGIAQLLPTADNEPESPVGGRVFKIARTPSGERVAYVRLLSGTLHTRDRVRYGAGVEGRVTGLSVFAPGGAERRASVQPGEIAKVSGLKEARVGDVIGDLPAAGDQPQFPPPTLESVVLARDPADKGRLHVALAELAEQDPLINVRQDDARHEISVSLYGEVQKQVIGATLAIDYGVDVDFHDSTTICIERPTGSGEALDVLRAMTKSNVTGKSSPFSENPFMATLGLRVEPLPNGSGIELGLNVDVRLVPLYIFKTVDRFVEHMHQYLDEALREGPLGWRVTDCLVTIIDSGYRAPETGASDFRKLTQRVLQRALARAGTQVCQPMAAVRIELPSVTVSAVIPLLARLRGRVQSPVSDGDLSVLEAIVPVEAVDQLQRALPRLTSGEGAVESRFDGYEPVNQATRPPRYGPPGPGTPPLSKVVHE
jgi:ribosomal protection tetracycline resistance protein